MHDRPARTAIWVALGILVTIVLVFVGIRLATDVPNITSGRLPDEAAFEYRYAVHAFLAYAHILPGVAFLLIAPFQLWRRFRNRHLRLHRRLGRVALGAGLVSGVFAIVFGGFQAYGGIGEASAAVAFGAWFGFSLISGWVAGRRRDIATHRRWMIRAFAVGVAVGTIRIWIGLFEAFGILELREAFDVAFWISFIMHAAVAELYLRWRPSASGRPRRVPA